MGRKRGMLQYVSDAGSLPFCCEIIPTAAYWEKIVGIRMGKLSSAEGSVNSTSSSVLNQVTPDLFMPYRQGSRFRV